MPNPETDKLHEIGRTIALATKFVSEGQMKEKTVGEVVRGRPVYVVQRNDSVLDAVGFLTSRIPPPEGSNVGIE